jgi:RNA polymerase sigma factor (sigma-70 family)
MVQRQFDRVLRYLHRVADKHTAQPADGDLLRRFIEQRDESAFALLVERHGNMVLGVCRRVLHHTHDAEDVFQATFLVLARKASSIRKRQSLSSWLYGVAYRTALKVRGRPIIMVPLCEDVPGTEPSPDSCAVDLRPVLDEELSRLPDKYRDPVVLCYLEGKTNEEAARQLGWTKGTVSGRLARARDLLRHRLTRRGLALTPALLTGFLCEQTVTASVSAPLLVSTVQAVGGSIAGATTSRAAILAEGVLKTMMMHKIKTVVGVVLALAILAGATSWIPQGLQSPDDATALAKVPVFAKQAGVKEATDEDLIQGAWEILELRYLQDQKTMRVAYPNNFRIHFQEGRVFIDGGTLVAKGIYNMNPGNNPKQIDLRATDANHIFGNGLGIYKLDGDSLTICLGQRDKEDYRPAQFELQQPGDQMVLVLQRSQPKKVGSADPTKTAFTPALLAEKQKNQATVAVLQAELEREKAIVQQLQQERAALQEAWKEFLQKKITQNELDKLILGKANELERLQAENEKLRAVLKEVEAKMALLDNQEEIRKILDLYQKSLVDQVEAAAQRDKALALKKLSDARTGLKEQADRTRSANNLKQIGLAFHNYHDAQNHFPAQAIYSKTGQPLLSWRVAILPYLNEDALYREFKLDEPWDSPHNIKLLDKMPKQFAPVTGAVKDKNATFYQVFTGPKTMFDGSRGLAYRDIPDGTSNTALVVEAGKPVPWTKPEDLPYQANNLPKLGGMFGGGFNLLIADGSVRFVNTGFNAEVLNRLILPADREKVKIEDLNPPK